MKSKTKVGLMSVLALAGVLAGGQAAMAATYDDWPTNSLEYHSSDSPSGASAYGRIEWDGVVAFDTVHVSDDAADGKSPRVQIEALYNNGTSQIATTKGSELSGYGSHATITVGFDAAYKGGSKVSYIRHRVCNGGSDTAPANCGSWGGYYQP